MRCEASNECSGAKLVSERSERNGMSEANVANECSEACERSDFSEWKRQSRIEH